MWWLGVRTTSDFWSVPSPDGGKMGCQLADASGVLRVLVELFCSVFLSQLGPMPEAQLPPACTRACSFGFFFSFEVNLLAVLITHGCLSVMAALIPFLHLMFCTYRPESQMTGLACPLDLADASLQGAP